MGVKEQAPRCKVSGGVQSVDPEIWVEGSGYKVCTACGASVKFRVRQTDLPPWARIPPHRTDGTPCR